MQKILVIQTAFIGDVVLATGLLEKLHSFYPTAAIDCLVRKGNEGLFIGHPFLHEVLIWHKKESKYKHLLALLSQIRKNKYDLVVNIQRYAATGFLAAFSDSKMIVGFDKNPFSFLFTKKITHVFSGSESQPLHEIERNHLLIQHLTDAIAAKPVLYPSVDDFSKIAAFAESPYLCIAPASVWFTKQFPTDKWIGFLKEVPANYIIYLLGGPTDKDLCENIVTSQVHPNIINLAGKLNFLQSAALQKGAVMNYVNDSAPMHFASSVNAPVTAIYCSTIPGFGYGPLSDKSILVETEQPLNCRPCGIHGKKACPLGHFNCAHQITNKQLLHSLPLA